MEDPTQRGERHRQGRPQVLRRHRCQGGTVLFLLPEGAADRDVRDGAEPELCSVQRKEAQSVPYYEFHCCNERGPTGSFTIKLKMQEAGVVQPVCPCCGTKKVERIYGSFGGKFGDTGRFHERT